MIRIDGSYGEGGGAILRTALALSIICNEEVYIQQIRKHRPNKGLAKQHLAIIVALAEMTKAKVSGATLGSEEVFFSPQKLTSGSYTFSIDSAGSTALLLYTIALASISAQGPLRITVMGGTCGKWQMPIDYLQRVFLPYLSDYVDARVEIKKRGYYPIGQGEVLLTIKPRSFCSYKPLRIDTFCVPVAFRGIAHASSSLIKEEIALELALGAKQVLQEQQISVDIASEYADAVCEGAEIVLWAVPEGEKKISLAHSTLYSQHAFSTGVQAGKKLLEMVRSSIIIDPFLTDQIALLVALLPGSKVHIGTITSHLTTNLYVIEQFLGKRITITNGVMEHIRTQ